MVLSDLLTSEWADGLTRLPARGGDVTVVHVLDREELHPDLAGDLDLVDAETGEVVAVSLAPEQVKAYEARRSRVGRRRRRARPATPAPPTCGCSPTTTIEPLLLGTWREAGVLR